MPPTRKLHPLTTTLIGGLVFLMPLIVVLLVVGQALAVAAGVVEPLTRVLPFQQVGGIAVVTGAAVLLLVCYGAGMLARAAVGRALSARFEDQPSTLYPRYVVLEGMAQGLHSALGQRVLNPVLATFDDHQLIAQEIERLADGRVVVFAPGAPDAWSGSIVLVAPQRVEPLDVDAAALSRSMKGLGHGLGRVLGGGRPPMPRA